MSIPYQNLFIALDKNKIAYLVAGGFAVNFHQVNRATVDLDLILHLERENILIFDRMMNELGYRPRLPVSGKDLANEETRKNWMKEKNMLMFTYIDSKNPLEIIDIFIEEPKPFSKLDENKILVEAFGVKIPVIGIQDLIEIKKKAGRERDLYDVSQLEQVRNINRKN